MEPDVSPQPNTFKWIVWRTVVGLQYLRAYWGRRFAGGAIGLLSDTIAEATQQATFARMPGHPQQAPDSLSQSAADRALFRFRGETDANWLTRVQEAWDDYAQGGTIQQLLKVINQWGNAGWPLTWVNLDQTDTDEHPGSPTQFITDITIPFGLISPPIPFATYGSGHVYGELGLFYGLEGGTDFGTLVYLVKKWKRSASIVKLNYEFLSGFFVTVEVR